MELNSDIQIISGKVIIAVAALGMFTWGAHYGRILPAGHNLLQASAVNQPAAHSITLASLQRQVAQVNGPSSQSAAGSSDDDDDDSDAPGAIFQDVYSLMEQKYVDTMPTNTQFAHGAAAAMLASLQDPNTRFLRAADMAEMADESEGIYHGLGASTIVRSYPHPALDGAPAYTELRLTIVAPMPGSPAEQAGLHPGDYITAVNGQQIANLIDSTGAYDPALDQFQQLKAVENDPVSYNNLVTSLENQQKAALPMTEAQSAISNGSQKPMVLTVMRLGQAKPLKVTVLPHVQTTVPPVTYKMLPGDIGFLKIAQFTDQTAAQFNADLAALNPAGLKGLILDLRDCPGGLLEAGQSVAERLTTAASLGVLETKGNVKTAISLTPSTVLTCPIAVLVNGGTANTAELLAATLQESGDKLYGTTTFGDAADVRPVALRDGSGFTMTVGQLLTAQDMPFAGVGIRPNVFVLPRSGQDAAFSRAFGSLSSQATKAASSPRFSVIG